MPSIAKKSYCKVLLNKSCSECNGYCLYSGISDKLMIDVAKIIGSTNQIKSFYSCMQKMQNQIQFK